MPSRDASLGRADRNDVVAEDEIALFGNVDAAQNLDQRRFARAVLAKKRVDFAAMQVKVDAVERRHARKALGDAFQPQRERHGIYRCGHEREYGWKWTVVDGDAAARPRRRPATASSSGYFAGAASAGMILLSSQVGSLASALNMAPLGAQLNCAIDSPLSFLTMSEIAM